MRFRLLFEKPGTHKLNLHHLSLLIGTVLLCRMTVANPKITTRKIGSWKQAPMASIGSQCLPKQTSKIGNTKRQDIFGVLQRPMLSVLRLTNIGECILQLYTMVVQPFKSLKLNCKRVVVVLEQLHPRGQHMLHQMDQMVTWIQMLLQL